MSNNKIPARMASTFADRRDARLGQSPSPVEADEVEPEAKVIEADEVEDKAVSRARKTAKKG